MVLNRRVSDYDYLNNLIINFVFPYRNPLIFNFLNNKKKNDLMQRCLQLATKKSYSDKSCGGKARSRDEFKKHNVGSTLFDTCLPVSSLS